MQLTFRIEEPGRPARDVRVEPGMTIGRTDENDCVLDDGKVSGCHARVVVVDDALRIEDVGSSNGTQIVGGPTLSEGQSHPLTQGTRIEIGLTRVFVVQAITAASTALLDRSSLGPDLQPEDDEDDDDEELSEKPTTAHHVVDFELDIDDTASAKPTYSNVGPLDEDMSDTDATVLSPQGIGPAPDASTLVSGAAPKTTGEVARRHDVIDESAIEATVVSSNRPRGNEDATVRRSPPGTTVAASSDGIPTVHSNVNEAVAAMAPRLVFAGSKARAIVTIGAVPFTVGRKRSSEPSDADHAIDDTTVSTRHAEIKMSQRRFFLEDCGSKNGTFIDGRAIPVMASRELPSDAAVRFGGVDALFVVDRDSELEAVDRTLHPAAIKHLAGEHAISRKLRDAALAAHERGEHAGQLLVLEGDLEPHRWGDAIRTIAAHPRRTTRTFGVLMIVLLVIVVLAVGVTIWQVLF